MNSTNEPNDKSHMAPDAPLAATAPSRGPFTKTAFVAVAGGILCTGFALRSLAQHHWLIWYELLAALIGGYVCVVATSVCGIRSRFSLNRWFVTSLAGLLIAAYGLYFFHIAYTPDLFFLSEADIQTTPIILICDVERGDKLIQYRIAEVLRNRTKIELELQGVDPRFNPVVDEVLLQSTTGEQAVIFAAADGQSVTVTDDLQVYSSRIVSFEDTRLAHLGDLQAFREFVTSDKRVEVPE